jgi:hypothetical protein
VIVTNGISPLTAVHAHPPGVETVADPAPPEAGMVALACVNE